MANRALEWARRLLHPEIADAERIEEIFAEESALAKHLKTWTKFNNHPRFSSEPFVPPEEWHKR